MKRVILMRHAKSSWADLNQPDHDRPLNTRGLESSAKIGGWLKDNDYIPDEVLCSTAHRCVETWHGLEHVMWLGIQPKYDMNIYQAHVGALYKKLKTAIGDVVLMLGHNPGVSGFAEELLEVVPASQNFYNYPTAATTLIDFDIEDWSKLKLRSGQLHSFIVPRELGV